MPEQHQPDPALELDRQVALKFRTQLQDYRVTLRTDISEMAKGLQIARPTMHKFMHAKENEIEFPPISRAKIYTLWEELTQPEKIDPENPLRRYRRNAGEDLSTDQVREQAINNRKNLKAQGPDELLIAAGFTPQHMKWIGVSPDRYPQMIQIALLLDNSLLSFESFMRVTQNQLEETIRAVDREAILPEEADCSEIIASNHQSNHRKYPSPNEVICQRLKENPAIAPELKKKLDTKFNKAYRRICSESHSEKLTIEETLGLFSTILSNELNQTERFNLKFRILNLNFESLSLDLISGDDFPRVKAALGAISVKAEKRLNTTASSSRLLAEQFVPPVIQANITCSYAPQSLANVESVYRENIVFTYTACGTILNIATQAVALHVGFKESIGAPEISTKKFGNKMTSLVKCTAVLKCNDHDSDNAQGDWVDRDFLAAYIQSLLIAGEKWILFQIDNRRDQEKDDRKTEADVYLHIFNRMSVLEQKLKASRSSFHSYQFSVNSSIYSDLENISKESQALLEDYLSNERGKIFKTFSINLNRIFLLSKIHKLRLANMQGNLSEAKKLILEIDLHLQQKELGEIFLPIKMLFNTEEKLYELSSGTDKKMFGGGLDFWDEWLSEAKNKIVGHLQKPHNSTSKEDYPSDPDIDTYQCLGTIHSIAGRWLFYLGVQDTDLKQASEYFMEAAHYFSRIGLGQRVARCLALAGRVQIRLRNYTYAEQLKDFSELQVHRYLHAGHRNAFQQSALSEVYLLKGEYEFYANSNYYKGLEESLQGLKGAMWLGLARRMTDNLYNIWCCSKHIGDRRVEEHLRDVFPIFWEATSVERKKYRLNPLNNAIAAEVVDLLFDIQKKDVNSTWSRVAERFQLKSSYIWHRWYRDTSDDTTGNHPVGNLIDSGTFLNPISHSLDT